MKNCDFDTKLVSKLIKSYLRNGKTFVLLFLYSSFINKNKISIVNCLELKSK